LYWSLTIIILIKLWRRGWTGHVACSREKRNAYGIRLGKWKKREHLEDPDTDGEIILNV
jgi:hypothetical protein